MNQHRKALLGLAIAALSAPALAEMQPLDDNTLATVTGQTGIGIDIELAARIGEIRYVDSDGVGNGQGFLSLQGIRVGDITDFSDDTSAFGTASITDIAIDVDGDNGVVFSGGTFSGLDLDVDAFLINDGLVGGFEIENVGNVFTEALETSLNNTFGLGLSANNGAYTVDVATTISGRDDGSSGLNVTGGGAVNIGRIAYVDDGGELSLGDVTIFQLADESILGEDLNGDGDQTDRLLGGTSSAAKIDVIDNNGRGELAITDITSSFSVAIGSINIGAAGDVSDPLAARANSIGSLLIRDVSLVDTQVFIYAQ